VTNLAARDDRPRASDAAPSSPTFINTSASINIIINTNNSIGVVAESKKRNSLSSEFLSCWEIFFLLDIFLEKL